MQQKAFVIRVWQEDGACWGQIIEPLGEWQIAFHSKDELWQLLQSRLGPLDPQPPSLKAPQLPAA